MIDTLLYYQQGDADNYAIARWFVATGHDSEAVRCQQNAASLAAYTRKALELWAHRE